MANKQQPRMLFHRAHYSIMASQIRQRYPIAPFLDLKTGYAVDGKMARRIMEDLALSLAKRFKDDNPRFDPIRFLEACSPDNGKYPLAELWKEDE